MRELSAFLNTINGLRVRARSDATLDTGRVANPFIIR